MRLCRLAGLTGGGVIIAQPTKPRADISTPMAETNSIPEPPPADAEAAPPALSAPICKGIIALNVLVYLVLGLFGVGWIEVRGGALLRWGADYWPLTTSGQLWRLLTAAFLHFGVIHLAANMYALMSIGWLVERLLGRWFYAALYLVSAVVSSAVAVWWNPDSVSAGASGAVFAVYGALIGYLVIHRTTFPRQAVAALMRSMLIFVGVNVAFGLSRAGISN